MRRSKIGRKKMLFIQLALILALLPVLVYGFQLYPSPQMAMEAAAKDEGFEDSKIIGVTKGKDHRIVFCNKQNWTMVFQTYRHGLFFWGKSIDPMIFDREQMTKPFDYFIFEIPDENISEIEGDRGEGILFGILGDSKIDRIEAVLKDGRVMPTDFIGDGIFYIEKIPGEYIKVPAPNKESDDSVRLQWQISALNGYDKQGKCVKQIKGFDTFKNGEMRLPWV